MSSVCQGANRNAFSFSLFFSGRPRIVWIKNPWEETISCTKFNSSKVWIKGCNLHLAPPSFSIPQHAFLVVGYESVALSLIPKKEITLLVVTPIGCRRVCDGGSSIFNFICGTLLVGKVTSLWRGAILPYRPHWLWLGCWTCQWGHFFCKLT